MTTLLGCAKQDTLKDLWRAVEWKLYAGSRGAIQKSECPDWQTLVDTGFARDGITVIHLARLNLGGQTFLFERDWLDLHPMMIAALIVQAYFLRVLDLRGRSQEARDRQRRLVCKLDSGGMCLDLLAAAFNKGKHWASKMRKRLSDAGWCSYKRRFSWATELEECVARLIGESDRYIKVGKAQRYLKEHTSSCVILKGVEFKSLFTPFWKRVPNTLENYAIAKGRECA